VVKPCSINANKHSDNQRDRLYKEFVRQDGRLATYAIEWTNKRRNNH